MMYSHYKYRKSNNAGCVHVNLSCILECSEADPRTPEGADTLARWADFVEWAEEPDAHSQVEFLQLACRALKPEAVACALEVACEGDMRPGEWNLERVEGVEWTTSVPMPSGYDGAAELYRLPCARTRTQGLYVALRPDTDGRQSIALYDYYGVTESFTAEEPTRLREVIVETEADGFRAVRQWIEDAAEGGIVEVSR